MVPETQVLGMSQIRGTYMPETHVFSCQYWCTHVSIFGDVPKHTFLFLGMSPNIGLGILGGHIHTQHAQRCLSLQMHHTKGQLRIGHIGLLVQGQVLHDFSQAGIFPPVLFGDGFPQIGNYNASHIRQWHFILAKPYTQSAKSKLICICLAFL